MSTQPVSAPADHLNPQRTLLAQLSTRLDVLRQAVPLLQRMLAGAHYALLSAAAAVLAYLPPQLLGLKQSYWGALTAIAVTQTEITATTTTARDQFVGAAIGGLVGLGAMLLLGDGLWVYAVSVVIAMWFCWTLNVSSAARLSGTTVTMILLVPRTESPGRIVGARLFEVGWGVCVAVMIVWLAARLPLGRAQRKQGAP